MDANQQKSCEGNGYSSPEAARSETPDMPASGALEALSAEERLALFSSFKSAAGFVRARKAGWPRSPIERAPPQKPRAF